MLKATAALAALLAVSAFSVTASACERHKEHTASTTAAIEAVVVPPPAAPRPVAEDETVLPQTKPEMATKAFKAYGGGCMKRREQTVYLTQ